MFVNRKKIIPGILILTALILTVYFAQEIYKNYQEKHHVQKVIADLEVSSQQQRQAMRAPPPPPKTADSDLPARAAAPKSVADPYTLEIEAQGIKLKMINEATWSMIFKICFLWSFVLASLVVYRRFTR